MIENIKKSIMIRVMHVVNRKVHDFCFSGYTQPMLEVDRETKIERLKAVYRDFVAKLAVLKNKRDRVLDEYERQLMDKAKDRLRNQIDSHSV